MTQTLLGLPLEEALARLRAAGIEPNIIESRAPRRSEGNGALRVVRVKNGTVYSVETNENPVSVDLIEW